MGSLGKFGDVLIGVIALLLLAAPTVVVRMRRPPPPKEDQCKMLTEKITPLMIQEIATTRVTLNSMKCFTTTDDRSFWDKYGPSIIKFMIRGTVAGVAVNVPPPIISDQMKTSSNNYDAVLYETTVSIDFGIPMDHIRHDWVKVSDGRLVICLPPPKALGLAKVDLDRSKRIDQQTNRSTIDASKFSQLDQEALDYTQKNAQKWAVDLGVDKTCREKTRAIMTSLISQFNTHDLPVSISFDDEIGASK